MCLAVPTLPHSLTRTHCSCTRWDAKLGFQHHASFRVSLQSLRPTGGIAPVVDIIVARRYQLRYLERAADGSRRTLSTHEERLAQQQYTAKYVGLGGSVAGAPSGILTQWYPSSTTSGVSMRHSAWLTQYEWSGRSRHKPSVTVCTSPAALSSQC